MFCVSIDRERANQDKETTISHEDKEKIKGLLTKPFNPYIRRHSALTEKSTKLKSSTLNQHAGWSPNSDIIDKTLAQNKLQRLGHKG
jgi:hypothetical protein